VETLLAKLKKLRINYFFGEIRSRTEQESI
jgi:hypothetical protein